MMRTVKQRWKALALTTMLAMGLGSSADAYAATVKKSVTCVVTNTGQFFPVVRVSLMAVVDGGNTFEIVLKDGQGEAGVESISFEKHEVEIDFSKYQTNSDGSAYIDMSKPVFLLTSTGKYWKLKELPTMEAKDGSDLFDVKVGSTTETDVKEVYFFRGNEADISGIDAPMATVSNEQLTLMTPVSEKLALSGCGDATRAVVYGLNGTEKAQAGVANGATTVEVGHLPAGVYIVKVGHKSLKFTKK